MMPMIPPVVWRIGLYVLAITAWSGFCYVRGMQRVEADWEAAKQADRLTAQVEFLRIEKVINHVSYQYLPQVYAHKERTKTIIKRVPEYIPIAADAACRVPYGFAWLYNAAADGVQIPDHPGVDPATDSGIRLSEVAATTVGNFGKYHAVKAQCEAAIAILRELPQTNSLEE